MTPAQLQTIEKIYRAALDQEPIKIGAFLDTACEGDEPLRRKVEALLSSRQRAASFIETSAVGLATRIIQNGQTDLLIGRTIGHYKISERIGTGGMGEVYLATDVTAGRKAALKLLPVRFTGDTQRLKRFQREARAVVGLNHPNILTVYEIGEDHSNHYIASELIEGETLRQRLMRGRIEVGEAVDVAIQVASALAAAHEAGIVHRDIKPENIMLRPDGYVKVLDFGIAKLAESAFAEPPSVAAATFGVLGATADGAESMTPAETNLGSILGTVRYMSPEQACGAQVDKGTDIWSLGVVLYEMVTAHAPFTGATPKEVMSAILEKEPPSLTRYIAHAPAELQEIISKTLRKNRGQRYHSAHELLEALKDLRHKLEFGAELERATAAPLWRRWTRSPAALALVLLMSALALTLPFYWHRNLPTSLPPEKSIAVLPLQNLSDDKENAYFAEGIQEEILTRLASIGDLKVISRSSTQRYQNKPRNLSLIAKQLGVANILEGSVQKAGDQVRVNVQLINAQTDSHLWAETYDRKLTDIFGVESEIAKGIAEALQAKLTGREEQALSDKPTNNPEAYDAYLRGLAFEGRISYSMDLKAKAIGFYEQAVQLDPKFALAWARLSRGNGFLYFFRVDPTDAARGDAAKRALENAQKLQPNLPETQLALGYYQYYVLRDYRLAETTFDGVLKRLPGSSEARRALGIIARREGKWGESIAYFEQALALDPRNFELVVLAADTYAFLRQFPAALKLYDRALDIMPDVPDTIGAKVSIYQAQGDLQEAAKFLSADNKIRQLQFERNYGEAIRLLQARLAQFHYDSQFHAACDEVNLAFMQRLAGDSAGAKVTAEQARNTLEQLFRDQPDNADFAAALSQAYAMMGEKDSALRVAERAVMLRPTVKDQLKGPGFEENLALIQTIFGENSQAISTITRLLHTPYQGWLYGVAPITPALLRLDPIWDPLRGDPEFRNLCEEKIDKSIAVLPFENLSRDPDNAYFAEGIQEEILTRLASIGDLKVISRSSTQRYQNKPRNLSLIAKQLGVANILEGSVQKTADQVRVNVQLVNAQTDSHLWAETYDQKLTDIFGVQSEIAKGIADSLQVKLTGREEQALAVKPTNNPEAYDAYLRGVAFQTQGNVNLSVDPLRKAIGFFQRAVQLDANFALAWARLSRAHAFFAKGMIDPTAGHRDAAKRALENAQKLQPNSPETLLALGYYQYWVLHDYGVAKITFGLVSKMLPGSSEVPAALAFVTRRQGHWKESVAYFEQGLALDPHNSLLQSETATTYALLRQFPTALKLYDRMLDMLPNDPNLMALKARIYQGEGNLQEAAKLLVKVNALTPSSWTLASKITQLRLERNLGEAVRLLQARLAQFHYDSPHGKASDQVELALMQRLAGDTASAKVTAEQARNTFEPLCRDRPDDAGFAARLSLSYAALGNKDSALKEAERAIMLSGNDRLTCSEEILALIQVIFGENSRAISTLTQLLQMPYEMPAGCWLYYPAPVTPVLLRLDPIWDPLRTDPAFQKLCEDEKSIAVLPFQNLSADPENAFFTDGVQDEILNYLAKIADLKVISRTSAMQYKTSVKRNLREIANELGVTHVVEGSVQRAANRVRVSAQLIDARNDTHVWGEKYDRDLADVFAIQSEIAKAIADQLQAKLSPKDKAAIMERPTKDLAAYDLYLRAKELLDEGFLDADLSHARENYFKAVQLLDQAVARDPAFSIAYCQLAFAHDLIYFFNLDQTETRLALAETSVRAAVRLQPDSGETHLAQAIHFYWGYRNYDRAREELAKAERTLPNNARIFWFLGLIDRRQGRWDEALRNSEHAVSLDPRNVILIGPLWSTYFMLRRYEEGLAISNRQLALEPRNILFRILLPKIAVDAEADTAPLRAVINTIEAEGPSSAAKVAEDSFQLAVRERDPAAAARALANIPSEGSIQRFWQLPHAWYEGSLAKLRQDAPGAHSAFAAARAEAEKIVRSHPESAGSLNVLALIDAELGQKEKAIQEGRAVCDLEPVEKDAVLGVVWLTELARIYALTGEKDLALQQLEIVSKLPNGPSYGELRLDPEWDALRGDPRFDKIVAAVKAASR